MKRIIATLSTFGASSVYAATTTHAAAATPEHTFASFLPLILIVAVFYLMFFLPHRRRQKQQKQMLNTLGKGAEVLTNSGLTGVVDSLKDGFANVEIAKGVIVTMQQETISQILPKGTVKNL